MDPCLTTRLWKNGWTDFHENSRICRTGHNKTSGWTMSCLTSRDICIDIQPIDKVEALFHTLSLIRNFPGRFIFPWKNGTRTVIDLISPAINVKYKSSVKIILSIICKGTPPTCRQPWVWQCGIFRVPWSFWGSPQISCVSQTTNIDGRGRACFKADSLSHHPTLLLCFAKLGSCTVCKFYANSCVVSAIHAWRLFRNF